MNVARFVISSKHWGELKILRPYPKPDESWGELAPLRDTPWGDLLPIVSGEALSHALHGRVDPLMQEIGPHPHGLCRQVPGPFRRCAVADKCAIVSAHCEPGPRLPSCYVPPNVSPEVGRAVEVVASAWAEGRYVLIVEGAEFSF